MTLQTRQPERRLIMERASSIDHIFPDETLLGGATDHFTMDHIYGLN